MVEIARLGNGVVMAAVGQSAEDLARGFAEGKEPGHVRWSETCVRIDMNPHPEVNCTYGTISSFSPLRNRIGTLVIFGRTSSLAQV